MDILIDFAEEILSEYLPVSENFPERTKKGIVFSAQMRWLKYKKTTNPEQKLNLFVRALKVSVSVNGVNSLCGIFKVQGCQ